jgi:putative transposase
MLKTYKYRIYPNKVQQQKLLLTLDICKHLYNCALQDREQQYEAIGKGLNLTKQEHTLKLDRQQYAQLKDIHSQVLQDVLIRVDKAFQNFFRRVKQHEEPGYPRFKSEGRYKSITYSQQPGFKVVDKKLHLSKIGEVKIKLHRQMRGKVKTCTVIRDTNRWYACFSCEYQPAQLLTNKPNLTTTNKAVGIDVGVELVVMGESDDIHRI